MRRDNILLVEDDEAIRETLRLALELEGYTVVTATNGKEGIDTLSRMPRPFLILLDLMMPVMDGWGFVSSLEAIRKLKGIPVVVVTAFSDNAKSIKANQVIKKPVDLDELSQVVKHYYQLDGASAA